MKGDGISIPQIQLGTGQQGKEGRGKLSIKGGEVQQEKGFSKIKRKDLGKNKREKVVIVEKD